MFLSAGRRLISLAVLSFAALGFLAVPIGDRTGYEHTRALLGTREAERLGKSLSNLAGKLKDTLLSELGEFGSLKEEPADE